MLRSATTGRRRVVALFGSVGLMVILALAVIGPPLALGQATRTWVSGVGDDANPCSRTAPCKTFAGAISKTATDGEINCLDPGGFGGVTITKGLLINCEYTEGGVLVAGAGVNGIVVNAPAASIVILRGLDIFGAGNAQNGVRFIAGAALHIEDSFISRFNATNGLGVSFQPSGVSELVIRNTTIASNGTTGNGGGLLVQPTGAGGVARVTLDNVTLSNNFQGVRADSTGSTFPSTVGNPVIRVSITGCTATGNQSQGFAAITNTGHVEMMIDSSTSSDNGQGGVTTSGANAMLRVGRSIITGNNVGTNNLGGSIESYQTNQIRGNVSNQTNGRTNINGE
jgi:hypothetical protein